MRTDTRHTNLITALNKKQKVTISADVIISYRVIIGLWRENRKAMWKHITTYSPATTNIQVNLYSRKHWWHGWKNMPPGSFWVLKNFIYKENCGTFTEWKSVKEKLSENRTFWENLKIWSYFEPLLLASW